MHRVKEFSDECLQVSNNKLFCTGCREELSIRKNVINNHIKSVKHKEGKKRLATKSAKEKTIAEALALNDQECHPVGELLPVSTCVYRVKVVTALLKAGIPLNKLDDLREILEESALRLTDRSHMSDLIPFIHSQEVNLIKAEIANRPVSVVFDGTTRLGEAMAIVFRFVDDDLKVVQHLVRLQLLQKSMCGEEIARELITTLSVNYGISSDRLMAAMHDRAATNGVAMRTVKVIYPLLLDVSLTCLI